MEVAIVHPDRLAVHSPAAPYNDQITRNGDHSARALAAMLDTGANVCAIEAGVALDLELHFIRMQTATGVHGAREVKTYAATLLISQLDFLLPRVEMEAVGKNSNFQVLLGMNVLSHCDLFAYSGCTFELRY